MKTKVLMLLIISLTLSFIYSCKRNNSSILNLDFEQVDPKTKKPKGWSLDNDPGYDISIDSKIVYHRKRSLKIENFGKNTPKFNVKGGSIVIDNIKANKSIRLTGYIKTENTNSDSLGLFIMPGRQGYTFSKSKDLKGTNDWKEYSIDVKLNSELEQFVFGVCLFGDGKIWIDDLRLFIDGKQISKVPILDYAANQKELDWLQKHSIKIKTVQAETGFEDLQPLKQIIGNAQIVGLGENTHGSSEVFKMKHRLVEFLATEMGFTIFSIEAFMPDAYKLNDYVLYGKGDPKALLKGMYFWTWNTQEVLDMVEWMRKFNAIGKGKIQFTGFDMQDYKGALENLNMFSEKHDQILKTKLDSLSDLIEESNSKGEYAVDDKVEISLIKHKINEVLSYLSRNKTPITKAITLSGYNWVVQNATVMLQWMGPTKPYDFTFRDGCMAKNVGWILDNNPNEKIVLWAHNGHITKEKGFMGSFLSGKYGNNYFNIGFLSNNGTYTAWNSSRLSSTNILIEGKPGSFEYSFHKTGIPRFFFDFSQINENEPEGKWLTNRLNCRSIGSGAKENQFFATRISNSFNAIIYIDSTQASHCFAVY